MKRKIVLMLEAREDLRSIYNYVADAAGSRTGSQYVTEFSITAPALPTFLRVEHFAMT